MYPGNDDTAGSSTDPRAMGGYDLESSLGYLANQASRAIRRRFDKELRARGLGVTGEQFGVLVHVWRVDGRHQKDLAAVLAKDKTTMARLIKGLEARGMIRRVAEPTDLRARQVHLTDLGRSTMAPLFEAASLVLAEAARAVDPDDLAVCKDVLRTIYESLSSGDGGEVA